MNRDISNQQSNRSHLATLLTLAAFTLPSAGLTSQERSPLSEKISSRAVSAWGEAAKAGFSAYAKLFPHQRFTFGADAPLSPRVAAHFEFRGDIRSMIESYSKAEALRASLSHGAIYLERGAHPGHLPAPYPVDEILNGRPHTFVVVENDPIAQLRALNLPSDILKDAFPSAPQNFSDPVSGKSQVTPEIDSQGYKIAINFGAVYAQVPNTPEYTITLHECDAAHHVAGISEQRRLLDARRAAAASELVKVDATLETIVGLFAKWDSLTEEISKAEAAYQEEFRKAGAIWNAALEKERASRANPALPVTRTTNEGYHRTFQFTHILKSRIPPLQRQKQDVSNQISEELRKWAPIVDISKTRDDGNVSSLRVRRAALVEEIASVDAELTNLTVKEKNLPENKSLRFSEVNHPRHSTQDARQKLLGSVHHELRSAANDASIKIASGIYPLIKKEVEAQMKISLSEEESKNLGALIREASRGLSEKTALALEKKLRQEAASSNSLTASEGLARLRSFKEDLARIERKQADNPHLRSAVRYPWGEFERFSASVAEMVELLIPLWLAERSVASSLTRDTAHQGK